MSEKKRRGKKEILILEEHSSVPAAPERFPDRIPAENGKKNNGGKKDRSFRRGVWTGIGGTLAVILVFTLVIPGFLSSSGSSSRVLDFRTAAKINTLSRYIEEHYYKDVKTEDLQDSLYKGLFSDLDEYSEYFTPEEFRQYYSSTITGSFAGIGAVLTQDKKTRKVYVYYVYGNTPAKKAGLKKDDEIVKADGYTAADTSLDQFVTRLRGKKGSKVRVTVYRKSTGKTFTKEIVRDTIETPTISGRMYDKTTAYLYISSFTDKTGKQFEEKIRKLQAKGMKKLVIDLRNNGGGSVDASVKCLDRILPKGLCVYTLDKNGKKTVYNSTDKETLRIPIVILVNGNTASASEIFTGAMKDRKAATVIGTKTYGKGIVQTVQGLQDGSGVKLTTMRYYTPNGVCIQGKGIQPDITLKYKFTGSEKDAYSLKYDNQFQRALKVLQKNGS